MTSWFSTNFKGTDTGPELMVGEYIKIRVPGARTYITGLLRNLGKPDTDADDKIVGIGQSSKFDKDKDPTTLDMSTKGKPPGRYSLTIRADAGTGYEQGVNNLEFDLV